MVCPDEAIIKLKYFFLFATWWWENWIMPPSKSHTLKRVNTFVVNIYLVALYARIFTFWWLNLTWSCNKSINRENLHLFSLNHDSTNVTSRGIILCPKINTFLNNNWFFPQTKLHRHWCESLLQSSKRNLVQMYLFRNVNINIAFISSNVVMNKIHASYYIYICKLAWKKTILFIKIQLKKSIKMSVVQTVLVAAI